MVNRLLIICFWLQLNTSLEFVFMEYIKKLYVYERVSEIHCRGGGKVFERDFSSIIM